jgi:nucleoside 2-deoxyribosyltransferase
MRNTDKCPLCEEQAGLVGKGLTYIVTCRRCGVFQVPVTMTEQNYFGINNLEQYRLWLSIATRKNHERIIKSGRGNILALNYENIPNIANAVENRGGVVSAADELLIWLGNADESFSTFHKLTSGYDYPLASCRNQPEFVIVTNYLCNSGQLIEKSGQTFTENSLSDTELEFRITPKGFERIDELRITKHKTNAFVAMWFDKGQTLLQDAYENAMKKAIEDVTILKALRADKEHFNTDINDWILGNAKQSAFMIADFTGNRGGVYFEAGYAMGLGVEVIFTCQDNPKHTKNLHFDTNHRNHIFWKTPADLYESLVDRIIATVPAEYLKVRWDI